jgi:hypothetical protein
MTTEILNQIEKQIGVLKRHIVAVGNMRPGSLSVQYRNPAQQKTPFYQLSYTHQGKSRSEYVRPENVATVRNEINAYKRFTSMLNQLVALSIQASRIRCATNASSRKPPAYHSTPSTTDT